MSIENTDVIDFVSLDKNGNVVLTISDHLEWDTDNRHLLLLQNKINAYLSAIESGSLHKDYPAVRDKKVAISLVVKYWPSSAGHQFLAKVKDHLEASGHKFSYKKLVEKSE